MARNRARAMNTQFLTKDSKGRIADRLTVLLGLAALLKDGAFGTVSDRQRQALFEMLQTSEELSVLLRPILLEQDSVDS
jgi:hypothetical protein